MFHKAASHSCAGNVSVWGYLSYTWSETDTPSNKMDPQSKVHHQKLFLITDFKRFRVNFSSKVLNWKQHISLLLLLLLELHVSPFLPLPRGWASTAAFRSWGSAAGRRSLGVWVCGAVCTCCQAPPPLWPPDQCCGKTRSASSVRGHKSWSTVSGQGGRKKIFVEQKSETQMTASSGD